MLFRRCHSTTGSVLFSITQYRQLRLENATKTMRPTVTILRTENTMTLMSSLASSATLTSQSALQSTCMFRDNLRVWMRAKTIKSNSRR